MNEKYWFYYETFIYKKYIPVKQQFTTITIHTGKNWLHLQYKGKKYLFNVQISMQYSSDFTFPGEIMVKCRCNC